jgi:ClpP class serine protease
MTAPALFRDPWCITEEHLQLVVAIASRDEFFAEVREKAMEARAGRPLENTRDVTVRDGVAVIPVNGPLFRHANLFTELSGATSYAALRKDLQAALDNPSVRAILLSIDSPGGEANGVSELAGAIFAARGRKPIKAYVGGMGASAAYWLASAADEVIASDTAMLGSIGVRMAVMRDDDKTKARYVEIVSSQSPDKKMDIDVDADRARLQQRINALADVFIDTVARNRGTDRATVLEKFGRGDVRVGAHAVEAGLADRIGNFEAVLAELAQGDKKMSTKIGTALGMAEATEEQITERVTALSKFETRALAAFGVATAEEAIGKMTAAAEALGEVATLRAELAAERAAATQRSLRDMLAQGLAENRISLGVIQTKLPKLVGDEKVGEELSKQFAALESVTEEAVLGVACAARVTATDLRVIGAFISASEPRAVEPAREPKRDAGGDAGAISEVDREVASNLGISEDTTKKYGGVRSADDLKKPRAVARTNKEA